MSRKKVDKLLFIGLGGRIKKIRGTLTQTEFGKIIGVSQSQVKNYERGINRPGDDTLKKIAEYGRVTVMWLLHGEEKEAEAPHLREPGEKQIKIKEEPVPFERPAPGAPELRDPFLYAAVDTPTLAQIMIEVEKSLQKRKRELSFERKAHLYSLLYDQYQITGKIPDRAKIEEFLRLIN